MPPDKPHPSGNESRERRGVSRKMIKESDKLIEESRRIIDRSHDRLNQRPTDAPPAPESSDG